jgi:hypothetical protein
MAKRAKTSTGWFFGFKLHLIINDRGEILAFKLYRARLGCVNFNHAASPIEENV